ncbi:hypothetical protein AWM70_19570 [Paenibacillus yonginensis]|uniref:Uncharacterized protein n=1 Tax=Paenibacillus yonginensis TaxID=1462996 RepID=A0A1B1N501_9BACL|nr:hypothetical protein [Paenibacillus yonginensis]ANS76503.1 hypothetical protein AWM70_19570 [Paenibacillus yonginensis]
MILPLPQKFDMNEIFIIFSTVMLFALMFVVPRRVSAVTIMVIWTFNVFLALLADIILSVKPYELYFTVDHQTHELFDVILHFITYPALPYFVVNVYRFNKPQGLKYFLYLIFWAVLAITSEWISVKFHVFTYTGWKLYLSFLVYLAVFAVNIWLAGFIERRHPYKRTSVS